MSTIDEEPPMTVDDWYAKRAETLRDRIKNERTNRAAKAAIKEQAREAQKTVRKMNFDVAMLSIRVPRWLRAAIRERAIVERKTLNLVCQELLEKIVDPPEKEATNA